MSETATPTTIKEAIAITGTGYTTELSPEAATRRDAIITLSRTITAVKTPDQAIAAREAKDGLAKWRIEVEKSRVLAKEPILKAGKELDAFAKSLTVTTEQEERRVNSLLIDFAKEEAAAQAEKVRVAAEAQRAAAAEAERAAKAAQAAQDAQDAIRVAAAVAEAAPRRKTLAEIAAEARALDQAESLAKAANESQQSASSLQAAASSASYLASESVGIALKQEIDFEVIDIAKLYAAAPHLCKIEVYRSEVLSRLKNQKAAGLTPDLPGIKVVYKDKI
jgi:hypothetical protein